MQRRRFWCSLIALTTPLVLSAGAAALFLRHLDHFPVAIIAGGPVLPLLPALWLLTFELQDQNLVYIWLLLVLFHWLLVVGALIGGVWVEMEAFASTDVLELQNRQELIHLRLWPYVVPFASVFPAAVHSLVFGLHLLAANRARLFDPKAAKQAGPNTAALVERVWQSSRGQKTRLFGSIALASTSILLLVVSLATQMQIGIAPTLFACLWNVLGVAIALGQWRLHFASVLLLGALAVSMSVLFNAFNSFDKIGLAGQVLLTLLVLHFVVTLVMAVGSIASDLQRFRQKTVPGGSSKPNSKSPGQSSSQNAHSDKLSAK